MSTIKDVAGAAGVSSCDGFPRPELTAMEKLNDSPNEAFIKENPG